MCQGHFGKADSWAGQGSKGKRRLRRFLLRPVTPQFRETLSLQLLLAPRAPEGLTLLWGQFPASWGAGPIQVLPPVVCCLCFFCRFPFTPQNQKGLKITESDNKALLLVFFFPGLLANSPTDLTRCFLVPSSKAKTFRVPLYPLRAPNPSTSARPVALGRPYFTSRMEGFVSMMATMILSM